MHVQGITVVEQELGKKDKIERRRGVKLWQNEEWLLLVLPVVLPLYVARRRRENDDLAGCKFWQSGEVII